MSRDELRTRFLDYLDGLLEDADARRVEEEMRAHPVVAGEARRLRAALYRPYAPPARAGVRRPFLRYAAAFLAGVVVTLVVQGRRPAPAPAEAARAEPPVLSNLRIR